MSFEMCQQRYLQKYLVSFLALEMVDLTWLIALNQQSLLLAQSACDNQNYVPERKVIYYTRACFNCLEYYLST